jgi:hypothetical protein
MNSSIFVAGLPITATHLDVKMSISDIVHKSPFNVVELVNFEVFLFRPKPGARSGMGIATFANSHSSMLLLSRHQTLTLRSRQQFKIRGLN